MNFCFTLRAFAVSEYRNLIYLIIAFQPLFLYKKIIFFVKNVIIFYRMLKKIGLQKKADFFPFAEERLGESVQIIPEPVHITVQRLSRGKFHAKLI